MSDVSPTLENLASARELKRSALDKCCQFTVSVSVYSTLYVNTVYHIDYKTFFEHYFLDLHDYFLWFLFTGHVKFNTTEKCGGQILVNYRNKWEKVYTQELPRQIQERLCQELGCNGHSRSTKKNNAAVKICNTFMCVFEFSPSLIRLQRSLTGIFHCFTWTDVIFNNYSAFIWSCQPNSYCLFARKDKILKTFLKFF